MIGAKLSLKIWSEGRRRQSDRLSCSPARDGQELSISECLKVRIRQPGAICVLGG
jgi:hypothetical protein